MSPRLADTTPTSARVFLDTSAIFTQSATAPVRGDLTKYIHGLRETHPVEWYMPEVVLHERTAQMFEQAAKALPAVEILEVIVGHPIGVREEITRDRIQTLVEAELRRLGISILPLDVSTIDVRTLMIQAVYREPPFSPGPNEKGFRDALILATVRHEVLSNPADSPNLFLVYDDLLASAATSLEKVTVFRSLKTLKDHINIPTAVAATEVSLEYRRFNELLEQSAFHLLEGSRYVAVISSAISGHNTRLQEIVADLKRLSSRGGGVSDSEARGIAVAVNDVGWRTASILQEARSQFEAHFRESLLYTARAATVPLVFDETERPGLEENLRSLDHLLESMAGAQAAIEALHGGASSAEKVMKPFGADSRVILETLMDVIRTYTQIRRRGHAASEALRVLLKKAGDGAA